MEVELPNEYHLRQMSETIRVLETEQVELISVPVPEFEDGDPADIVHDFSRVCTSVCKSETLSVVAKLRLHI